MTPANPHSTVRGHRLAKAKRTILSVSNADHAPELAAVIPAKLRQLVLARPDALVNAALPAYARGK